jgi:hypothetical protein
MFTVPTMLPYLRQLTLGMLFLASQTAFCQTVQQGSSTAHAGSQQNPPCARPAAVFDIDDYNGPFNKLVASITNKLEITTVHVSHQHHPQHPRVCSLTVREKFHLFVNDSFEPVTFLDAAWDAGWAQLGNNDPAFGQGMVGYGKRYGAALTDDFSDNFFNTFFYPALFRQDPRYFRVEHGPVTGRLFYAMRHVFVTRSDSGHLSFNFSEWCGTFSAKALSNLYHPGNERGFGTVAQRTGLNITTDMGWDVMKEFWPEITRKFHLPFRATPPAGVDENSHQSSGKK